MLNKSKLKNKENNENGENDENEDPNENDEDILEIKTAFEELISGDTKHKNAFDWKNPYSNDYVGGITKGYSLDYRVVLPKFQIQGMKKLFQGRKVSLGLFWPLLCYFMQNPAVRKYLHALQLLREKRFRVDKSGKPTQKVACFDKRVR